MGDERRALIVKSRLEEFEQKTLQAKAARDSIMSKRLKDKYGKVSMSGRQS